MAREKKREDQRAKKSDPQSVRMFGDLTNRTGILSSSLASEMRENVAFTPQHTVDDFRLFRGTLLRDGGPIGTIPRPPTLGSAARQAVEAIKGARPLVLLDKLGERLAFERTGVRLYETLLAKYDRDGGFDDGPTAQQLRQIRDEELEHFHTLVRTMERLGADPTAVTPSADAAAVASMGVIQLVSDPRVRFAEALMGSLVAELVEVDCWMVLRELAAQADDGDLLGFTERAEAEEAQHLLQVRTWVKAIALGAASES